MISKAFTILEFYECDHPLRNDILWDSREFSFFCHSILLNSGVFGISIAVKPMHPINLLTTYSASGVFTNHQFLHASEHTEAYANHENHF